MNELSAETKEKAEQIRQGISNGVLLDYTARQLEEFRDAATAELR